MPRSGSNWPKGPDDPLSGLFHDASRRETKAARPIFANRFANRSDAICTQGSKCPLGLALFGWRRILANVEKKSPGARPGDHDGNGSLPNAAAHLRERVAVQPGYISVGRVLTMLVYT